MLHHLTYQGTTAWAGGAVCGAPCVDNVRCHGACALLCTAAPQPDMSETTSNQGGGKHGQRGFIILLLLLLLLLLEPLPGVHQLRTQDDISLFLV